MAEGFEGYYHVPQQSRRDKLRVNVVEPFLPFYDSSSSPSFIIPSDFSPPNMGSCSMKEQQQQQGSNLMMNVSSSNSSAVVSLLSHHHHAYLDPNNGSPSFPLNLNPAAGTNSIQVISNSNNNNNNNNPFLYQAQNNLNQNLKEFDSGIINDVVVFNKKAEPLSLSLSSSSQHKSGLPLELNLLQSYGSVIYGDHNNNKVGVCGGYDDPVMKEYSRFLKPAQQLLEEMCYVGGVCGVEKGVVVADASLMMEPLPERRLISEEEDHSHGGDGGEGRNYKSRLLTMLDEVYRRYRQYYQQMHAVVTSFEYVSGLSNAAPYASLAIKAMSKHFRCLKKAITNQLQFNNKAHSHISNNRMDEYSPRFGAGNSDRGGGGEHPYSHRPRFLEHQPVWRPQRGLPERAVTVLRAWLFEHFLHPYPTDTDKLMLAKQTGLSRSQVSNWFINARVRLWKPMVEEIHMLETRQVQKNPQKEEQHCRNKSSSDHLPSNTTSLVSENPATSNDKFQGATTYKHTMNVELPNIKVRNQEQLNLPFTGNNNNSNNSVSLTLGLYQNHGIGLAEPFPLSAAQHFGLAPLETNNNEGYVMSSGFESQSRHFGRDVIGGQLFHDFVG